MNQHPGIWHSLNTLSAVIIGNFFYALAVKLFLLPSGLVTGGTTGIALAAARLTGIPIPSFVLVFNTIMLVIGCLALGRQFAATTIVSTFAYPFFLGLLDWLLGGLVLTQDMLLCTVFTGIGIGLSLGIVIRAGASTGGMDIPSLVLFKFFRIPVSASIYAFDFIILLMQAFFSPIEKLLYGLLLVMVYTAVLDKMLLFGSTRTEVKVISRKAEKICRAITQEMDRGVTMLDGEGGYLHEKQKILLVVVLNRELPRLEKKILNIDSESFLVVSRVSEVRGRGFSMKKEYR